MREAVLDPERRPTSRARGTTSSSRSFLEHYPMERILLLDQDELLHDRRRTLERVYRFLGVDEGVWRETFNEPRLESAAAGGGPGSGCRRRSGSRRERGGRSSTGGRSRSRTRSPSCDDALRAELEDILRDDVAAFRELTGRRFESWSI